MAEKLLIITEKPSAYQAFEHALGGQSGSFNGNEFALVHLFGHIIGNNVPDMIALPDYKEKVGKFANLNGIPWNYKWFDFNNKEVLTKEPNFRNSIQRVLRDIDGYLKNNYIPVIASDIDPSGEGDLLVREVLIKLNYHGKTYREYHLDETDKGIQKSLKNLKEVTEQDPTYRVAFARSNMDYLTQQLTRVATMKIQGRGYRLPSPVPMGRLKSVIINIVGDQTKAIEAYKPSSVFESRYKLDNLVLSKKDLPQYKTQDEWQADGLPETSKVQEVKQVQGQTTPPKPFNLAKVTGEMSKLGVKSKQTKDLAQKLYEAHYTTYPRTEDNFVSPEQFNEMLPMVDNVLDLLEMPKSIFTHRQPRTTHVKTGGSHGALRPGSKLPKSLDDLDAQFGNHAGAFYKLVSERFLMMFLENTEWVRHEYETTDTDEPFKGSIKVITKQGVVDPDEKQDDVADKLPDLSQPASLFPFEVKSTKPHAITATWLYNQLDKYNVGTPATQVSTVAAMSGAKPSFPLKESKTFSLSSMGWVGYKAAQNTTIGSVDGTIKLTELVEGIRKGADTDNAYTEFTNIIGSDVKQIEQNTANINLDELKIPKEAPKILASGTWNGREIQFNRVVMQHEFTDDEVAKLLAGDEIEFAGKTKDDRPVKLRGKLADQEYKGHKFVGFSGQFIREGYVSGTWHGQDVTIKGQYMDHKFTDDELKTLFAGGEVPIETHKDGKTYQLTGKLETQDFKGKKFVGYKAVFPLKEGYVKGNWQGKEVTYKGSFMDYKFTDADNQKLLAGNSIHITTHKDDKTYEVDGKLAVKEYQGRKFVGFDAQFQDNREGMVAGKWQGKDVKFKGEFMQHKFTPSEIDELLAGNTIQIHGKSQKGKEMDVKGKLGNRTWQGRQIFGFQPDFGKKK